MVGAAVSCGGVDVFGVDVVVGFYGVPTFEEFAGCEAAGWFWVFFFAGLVYKSRKDTGRKGGGLGTWVGTNGVDVSAGNSIPEAPNP